MSAAPPATRFSRPTLLAFCLVGSALAFALSVPLAPHLPVSGLLGAGLAFAWVSLAVTGVAAVAPTLHGRKWAWLALPLALLAGVVLARPHLPEAFEAGLINLALLAFGSLLGGSVGGRVEHAGHLVLLAWVASVVDVVSVFVPEGPTAQIVASPEVALPLVTLSWPIFGTGSIEPLVGVGDISIASVYGAAVGATALSRSRLVVGLLLGFALTFVALVIFQRALPALPMLSLTTVLCLLPQAAQIPPNDRLKGIAFALVLTLAAGIRLATWMIVQ